MGKRFPESKDFGIIEARRSGFQRAGYGDHFRSRKTSASLKLAAHCDELLLAERFPESKDFGIIEALRSDPSDGAWREFPESKDFGIIEARPGLLRALRKNHFRSRKTSASLKRCFELAEDIAAISSFPESKDFGIIEAMRISKSRSWMDFISGVERLRHH